MTSDRLTAVLVEKILHWRVAPDRFLTGNRQWTQRWKFQPLKNLDDAFRLLDAASSSYSLKQTADGFTAEVRVGASKGIAKGESKPAVIAVAIARAVGLDVPDGALEPEEQ